MSEVRITLLELRDALARERSKVERIGQLMKQAKEVFDSENEVTIDQLATAKLNVTNCTEKIRALGAAYFVQEDAEPIDGLTSKPTPIYTYEDADAIMFCIEKGFQGCLALDRKNFEKIVPAIMPPCVKIETAAKVTIKKDLESFVQAADMRKANEATAVKSDPWDSDK